MAHDLTAALDDYVAAEAEYTLQYRAYRAADAAIGDVEWTRMYDASIARNQAFREAVRHALGMADV